jgi:hypothetical protein
MDEAEAHRVYGSEEFPVTNSTTFYCTRFTAGKAEVVINRPGTHLSSERSPLVCLVANSLIGKLGTRQENYKTPMNSGF